MMKEFFAVQKSILSFGLEYPFGSHELVETNLFSRKFLYVYLLYISLYIQFELLTTDPILIEFLPNINANMYMVGLCIYTKIKKKNKFEY